MVVSDNHSGPSVTDLDNASLLTGRHKPSVVFDWG